MSHICAKSCATLSYIRLPYSSVSYFFVVMWCDSQEITMQGTCLCHLTSQGCIIQGTGFIDKGHYIAILVIFNYHYHNWVFFNFNLLLKLYLNIDFDLICWKKILFSFSTFFSLMYIWICIFLGLILSLENRIILKDYRWGLALRLVSNDILETLPAPLA